MVWTSIFDIFSDSIESISKSFVDMSLTKPAEIFCPGRGALIVGESTFKSSADDVALTVTPIKKIIQ